MDHRGKRKIDEYTIYILAMHKWLRTSLDRFWNKNPRAMLDELYPDSYT
ncbi:hypothetical protein [Bacillus sp. SRB_331]|nr:hypothetical protein [Bacillus sp. SRB_331]